jgi:hypothetical protein
VVKGVIVEILRYGGEEILRQLLEARWREMAWIGHIE